VKYDKEEDACLGFVLSAEETKMLVDIANYMEKTPYEVIIDSIHSMHTGYRKAILNV